MPHRPFFTGFLEGYNTMDALASLASASVVVQVIQGLGVEKAESVAMTTVRSGILSCLLMGVIYLLVTLRGVWSRGALEAAPTAVRRWRRSPSTIWARRACWCWLPP